MKGKKKHEAIVFVLDVGPSMSEIVAGETDSYFGQSIMCIQWILQRKLFSDSKDELALVLCGTPSTSNQLATGLNGQYQNITEAKGLTKANLNFLRFVREKVLISAVSADFMDAIMVAMNVLLPANEDNDVSLRKILFFSNFGGGCSPDNLQVVIKGLNKFKVEFYVIGPNFDSDMDSDEISEHSRTQELMKTIMEKTNGEFYLITDALPQLMFYETKHFRSSSWNVTLDIGPDLHIPVAVYVKIKEVRPKPLKSRHCRSETDNLRTETLTDLASETSTNLSAEPSTSLITDTETMSLASGISTNLSTTYTEIPIANSVTEISYHRNDDAQTEVHARRAYKYGTTMVPVTEEDIANMKYKGGEKCLSILGFTKKDDVKIHYFSGLGSRLITGRKNDKMASTALSAIIHALFKTKTVAIVRYCYSAGTSPKMGFLAPLIKSKYEALIMVFLPFREDLHRFKFAPLAKTAKQRASTAQLEAIDDFITNMTLIGDDGEEQLKSSTILNPNVQHSYQCIAHRAVHRSSPLPPIEPQFMKKLSPSEKLLNAAAPAINRIKDLFPLKAGKKRNRRSSAMDLFGKKVRTNENN